MVSGKYTYFQLRKQLKEICDGFKIARFDTNKGF